MYVFLITKSAGRSINLKPNSNLHSKNSHAGIFSEKQVGVSKYRGRIELPQSKQRLSGQYAMNIGLIEALAEFFLHTNDNFNSCISQSIHPFGGHNGIGIHHTNNYFFNFGSNQSLSTRRSPPKMITRFQAHISRRILRQITSISQSKYLTISSTHSATNTNSI